MNELKIRMELHLEAGDTVPPAAALADALEGHATMLRIGAESALTGVTDVPRGQLAYVIEVKHVR